MNKRAEIETGQAQEQARMLADSAERFLSSNYALSHRRQRMQRGALDLQTWRSFGEMGWLALHAHEDDGGLGEPLVAAAPLLSALGRHLVIEPFVDAGIVTTQLLSGAQFVHRQRVLQSMLSGERVIVLAHGERAMGVASASPCTRWESTVRGARLYGEKHGVPAGSAAHAWVVTASGGQDGPLRAWMVSANAQGVGARPRTMVDGSLLVDLVFNGVEVEDSHELHFADLAGTLAAALRHRLAANGQVAVGALEGMLDASLAYAKMRRQFGAAISRFQVVQHHLVDMYAQLQLAKAVAHTGLGLAAEDMEDGRLSAGKATVAAACRFIREQGVQLHGGIGMTDECVASHYFRRLLVLEKSDGNALHHLAQLDRASA